MGEQPGGLASEAAQLRDAVITLATKVDVAQQQARLLRWLALGVTALTMAAVICGVILGVTLVQQSSRTNQFLKEGARSRAAIFRINDCIDPAGVCAKRSAANTAKVIGQIVDSNGNHVVDSKEILDAINALKGRPAR